MNMTKRVAIGVAVTAVIAGAATAAVALSRSGEPAPIRSHGGPRAYTATSLRARFAVLRRAHSNRCGMPSSALKSMVPRANLQGACCFPIDYASYVNQVHELHGRYADVDVIPKDPYDIEVSLAKRLLGYRSIELTGAQQRTYERAKPLSSTNGPCCCPCWRWDAFEGQARFLITRRNYTAKQIADVWSTEEGCGGPSHEHA